MKFLLILTLIILSSTIARVISNWVKIPTVVGQLITGIVLGPAVLNWVRFDTFISYFFNLGVIILMFIAGLDSNLKLLRQYLRPSLIVASTGVLLPMITIPLIGRQIGLPIAKSLFLGVTFSATSVSITVTVLKGMKLLRSRAGTTILGAAVADDVMAVVLLSLVSIVTHQNLGNALIPSQDFIWLMAAQVIFFSVIWLLIRWFVPWLFRRLPLSLNNYDPTLLALGMGLFLSWLASSIGLSAITGSFFAGIAIGQTNFRQKVQRETSSLGYLLFIPVFFVSIGLSMTLSGITRHWLLLVIMTIAAVLTKWLGAGLGSLISGFNVRNSLIIGSSMISRGEVALIIAQLGLANHLLSANLYSIVICAVILTTSVAPLIMKVIIK